jgi:hypothetical protein
MKANSLYSIAWFSWLAFVLGTTVASLLWICATMAMIIAYHTGWQDVAARMELAIMPLWPWVICVSFLPLISLLVWWTWSPMQPDAE